MPLRFWPCFRLESPSCTEPLVLSPLNARIQCCGDAPWYTWVVAPNTNLRSYISWFKCSNVVLLVCVRQKPFIVAWSKMQQQSRFWVHNFEVEIHSPPPGFCQGFLRSPIRYLAKGRQNMKAQRLRELQKTHSG